MLNPEQRAAKVQKEIDGRGIWKNAIEVEMLIARAIRAAENTAYESAATTLLYAGMSADMRGPLMSKIRAFKTRAPRKTNDH